MKAVVAAFNQEKALIGAFSVIVQPVVEPMDRFTELALVAELRGVRWSTNGQAISGHQLEPAIILTQIFTRIPPTNYKIIKEKTAD